MRITRAVLLCAGIALAPLAGAVAREAVQGIVLTDASGAPVAVLVPVAAQQAPDPMLQMVRELDAMAAGPDPMAAMMAEQEAVLDRVAAQMQALDTAPFAVGQLPQGAVSRMVVSTFSGRGGCSETVTISGGGDGMRPQMAVQKVGDACGGPGTDGMRSVPAALPVTPPAPLRAAPPQLRTAPDGSRLIQVDYRRPLHPTRPLHRS